MRNCACVSFFILCLRFQYRICLLRRFFGRLHRFLLPEVPLLWRLLTWAYFINKCICQQNLLLSLKRFNSSNFCLQKRIAHQFHGNHQLLKFIDYLVYFRIILQTFVCDVLHESASDLVLVHGIFWVLGYFYINRGFGNRLIFRKLIIILKFPMLHTPTCLYSLMDSCITSSTETLIELECCPFRLFKIEM